MVEKYKKHTILIVLLIALIVFTAGILFGRTWTTSYSTVDNFIKQNELNTQSYLIEQDLIRETGGKNCKFSRSRFNELTNELSKIGRKLTEEDTTQNIQESQYKYLKTKYHLIQIKTYLLFKEIKENCKIKTDTILYYYSPNQKESEKQGQVLDKIRSEQDIYIFAIQKDYSNKTKFLEDYYNIQKTPSIIINYNNTIQGYTNYSKIKNRLG